MVDPYYPSGGISCFNLEGRGFIELKGVQIGLPKKKIQQENDLARH